MKEDEQQQRSKQSKKEKRRRIRKNRKRWRKRTMANVAIKLQDIRRILKYAICRPNLGRRRSGIWVRDFCTDTIRYCEKHRMCRPNWGRTRGYISNGGGRANRGVKRVRKKKIRIRRNRRSWRKRIMAKVTRHILKYAIRSPILGRRRNGIRIRSAVTRDLGRHRILWKTQNLSS